MNDVIVMRHFHCRADLQKNREPILESKAHVRGRSE